VCWVRINKTVERGRPYSRFLYRFMGNLREDLHIFCVCWCHSHRISLRSDRSRNFGGYKNSIVRRRNLPPILRIRRSSYWRPMTGAYLPLKPGWLRRQDRWAILGGWWDWRCFLSFEITGITLKSTLQAMSTARVFVFAPKNIRNRPVLLPYKALLSSLDDAFSAPSLLPLWW